MTPDPNLRLTVYEEEGIAFFWKGILSQWWLSQFYSYYVKEWVTCAEQAMMLSKAYYFGDRDTFNLILSSSSPREQKRLGRLVRDFSECEWSLVRFDIVVKNNYDRARLDRPFQDALLSTRGLSLVEASPYDRIWGIGMDVGNPEILNRENWGENLLGDALVEVREIILKEIDKSAPL